MHNKSQPYNKSQPISYLFTSTIKPNPKPFQFKGKEKKNRGRRKCGTLKGFAWYNVRKAERLKSRRKTESEIVLPTFLLYCFALMATFLSSSLPVFLSTRCINIDSACFNWGISKSQFFFAPFFCLMIFVSLITFCYMDWFAARFWIFIIVLRVWDFDGDIID